MVPDLALTLTIPAELEITVELNTRITNVDWRRCVVKLETAPLTYDSGGIDLVAHHLTPIRRLRTLTNR